MSDGEVIPVIPVPRTKKAKASVWRDIGVAETDYVLRLSTVEDTRAFIIETFGIREDSDGRGTIVLDMFYYAVQFCKEYNFNSEKTSCFLSILKQIHEMAIETPFGNIKETLEFLKDLILCHSVHRPPFSLGIFSPQEATAVSNYFIDSYFRHFKMYKYVFNPQVQLDLTINYTAFPNSSRESGKNSQSMMADAFDQDSSRTQQNEDRFTAEDDEKQLEVSDQAPALIVGDSNPDGLQFDSDTDSMSALKRLIRERLKKEMGQLQASVSAQLQRSDEEINKATIESARKQQSAAAAAKKKK
ncbi:hypothetical protein BOX15_Mlig002416g2 [Macrostomum lignano]|uniref:Uncharacterized protein n=2 Tax=Macrostomum lignano TaxID=282301 RepID=A0A267G1A8_9PLAT|nr:hypothetical protein BOX15_Mlig002416g2 [Macrostomum lignano]